MHEVQGSIPSAANNYNNDNDNNSSNKAHLVLLTLVSPFEWDGGEHLPGLRGLWKSPMAVVME
jgi:hypothetical protein